MSKKKKTAVIEEKKVELPAPEPEVEEPVEPEAEPEPEPEEEVEEEVEEETYDSDLSDLVIRVTSALDEADMEEMPERAILQALIRSSLSATRRLMEWRQEQLQNDNEELSQIRDMLPEDESVTPRRTGTMRPRSGKKLTDYNIEALKEAGRKGLTKYELAEKVTELGYEPSGKAATDMEAFSKSNYVSGVNPLLGQSIEHFKVAGEREGRYRLILRK